ncbi:hypothetical protein RJ639_035087 [Escallonia herrerae]|uniref:RanBD1 domain-containing protein n=1 Tax=Escallonia herrerae TaxID=1293975 RepID=A0AA88WN97_9ASTE|nr:hypothetical protein RJ639_035087 [Escallonia herrerae]
MACRTRNLLDSARYSLPSLKSTMGEEDGLQPVRPHSVKMSVQEHVGNDKSCVWHAADFADGELKDELFCIRFQSVENCKNFMETMQEVAESQQKKEESKDASDAAGLIKKLTVEDKKSEEKTKEEDTVADKEEKVAESEKRVEELASST